MTDGVRDLLRALRRPRVLLIVGVVAWAVVELSVAAEAHGVPSALTSGARNALAAAVVLTWVIRRERRSHAPVTDAPSGPPTPADVAELLRRTPPPDRATLRPLLRGVAGLSSFTLAAVAVSVVLAASGWSDPDGDVPRWWWLACWAALLVLGSMTGVVGSRRYLGERAVIRAAAAGTAPRCPAVVIGDDVGSAVVRLLDGTERVRVLSGQGGDLWWLGQGDVVVLDGPLEGREVSVAAGDRQGWARLRVPHEDQG